MNHSCRFAVLAALGFGGISLEASAVAIPPTVPLPGVGYAGSIYTSFRNGGQPVEESDVITSPSGGLGGNGDTGSAHASYGSTLGPPGITIAADAVSSDFFNTAQAQVNFVLYYYFVVTGPGPSAVIDISAQGFGSAEYLGDGNPDINGGVGQEWMGIGLPQASPPIPFNPSVYASPYRNWTENGSVTVLTDTLYEVVLNAGLYVHAQGGSDDPIGVTATATVDPWFSINPGNPGADQYALFFSDGVVNAPVPNPPCLALFAAGLGWLGLVARRKRSSRA